MFTELATILTFFTALVVSQGCQHLHVPACGFASPGTEKRANNTSNANALAILILFCTAQSKRNEIKCSLGKGQLITTMTRHTYAIPRNEIHGPLPPYLSLLKLQLTHVLKALSVLFPPEEKNAIGAKMHDSHNACVYSMLYCSTAKALSISVDLLV